MNWQYDANDASEYAAYSRHTENENELAEQKLTDFLRVADNDSTANAVTLQRLKVGQ